MGRAVPSGLRSAWPSTSPPMTATLAKILVADDESFAVVALNSSNYCGIQERLRGLDERDLDHLATLPPLHACTTLATVRGSRP